MNKEVIKKLDFKNLDPKQEEQLHLLLSLMASSLATGLESIDGNKDEIMIGCMCGKCTETISITQLILEVQTLTHRGLDQIIQGVQTDIYMDTIREKKTHEDTNHA